jgi:hypothetical protein
VNIFGGLKTSLDGWKVFQNLGDVAFIHDARDVKTIVGEERL